jgi:glycosyltransferase involved in cell wall biosynthesis
MTVDFSVAIRTYNGADSLPRLLDHLLAQHNPDQLRWEVVVVDNNSTDATPQIIAEYAQRWRPDSELRRVLEPQQGAAYARNRSMQEAQSDLVGFLDDDNVPEPDWMMEAVRFGRLHPEAGVYGAKVIACFDQTPPPGTEEVQFLLAADSRGDEGYLYPKGFVPNNPGCVIRKQAWQASVPLRRHLLGPVKQNREDKKRALKASNAEDIEVMYYIQSGGWQMWHHPAMQITHYLPVRRLDPDYLKRLALFSGLSAHACRIAKLPAARRPWMPLLIAPMVGVSAVRLASFYLKNWGRMDDLPTRCQMLLRLGNLLSPFCTPGRMPLA